MGRLKIHFIGIAGAGMESLATYLSDAGHTISGSDPRLGREQRAFWEKRGAKLYDCQTAENIGGADMVVYSAAVPLSNPERLAAESAGIGISRGDCLAHFANAHQGSIAICGTHGKGTTAAAVLAILEAAKWPTSAILGATPVDAAGPSTYAAKAQWLVSEVDESDRTHLAHRPKLLLINNVEVDHLNTYRDLDDIVDSFAQLVRASLAGGADVILHYSGVGAPKLYESLKDLTEIAWLAPKGAIDNARYSYELLSVGSDGCHHIELCGPAVTLTLDAAIGGLGNAENLASAAAIALCIGVDAEIITSSLSKYKGLRDRCQLHNAANGVLLVTDYASHPTAVANDIAWIGQSRVRTVVIYHPFRYSLMAHHWEALALALAKADLVLIAPFDGAGEAPTPGLDSHDLARRIEASKPETRAHAFESFDAMAAFAQAILQNGDALIVFGGGKLFDMGKSIVGLEPDAK